jgi:hypothetical protein
VIGGSRSRLLWNQVLWNQATVAVESSGRLLICRHG